LAAVAASTASDLEEISTGMSKVASAANAMGVPLDSLNAQLATIVSVTRQAPESVGTALKTIYARMSDLKMGGKDEDGLGLGDVSGQLE
jgi:TP901 family phage tail tape measure protein